MRFACPGNPLPCERPRFSGHAYMSKKTTNYQEWVRVHAKSAGVKPLPGPVHLTLAFYRSTATRCDIDNLEKNCLDALKGIAFLDDAQVCSLQSTKAVDRKNPRVEIEILSMPSHSWPEDVSA